MHELGGRETSRKVHTEKGFGTDTFPIRALKVLFSTLECTTILTLSLDREDGGDRLAKKAQQYPKTACNAQTSKRVTHPKTTFIPTRLTLLTAWA